MSESKKEYSRALTVAGSDSGGGAGIQADLKTFSAVGVYGLSVITALTAQNTAEVEGIFAVPADFVKKQLQTVLRDIGADAIKTGMLYSKEIISAVAGCLETYQPRNLVIDPVIIATSGDKLLEDDAVRSIIDLLLPISDLVTPNIPEAEVLSGIRIKSPDDLAAAAKKILSYGTKAVLIKGGHLSGPLCTDLLFRNNNGESSVLEFTSERIDTCNTHGTGCTFSAAIAAYLAQGQALESAVSRAKKYLDQAILEGSRYRLGSGHGPVKHF